MQGPKSKCILRYLWISAMLMLSGCTCFLNAQNPEGYYLNAVSFVNTGNYPQAMGEVHKALDLDPDHPQSLYLRAFIHLQTGNKDEALSDYNHLLRMVPAHEGALNNRALLLMEKGRYDDALKDLNQRIAIEDTWSARFDRAYCLALMDRHKEAANEFSKVIEKNPDYAAAYANRGYSIINLHTNQGLTKPGEDTILGACADLKKALSLGDTSVVKSLKKYCK